MNPHDRTTPPGSTGQDSPLVSVLMYACNCESTIEQSVRNVLDQTYPHFELIVVDDGSSDGTPDILSRLTDRRLTLIQKDHTGEADSKNTARNHSRGEYQVWMGSRDRCAPELLEKELAVLSGSSGTQRAVFCWMEMMDMQGNTEQGVCRFGSYHRENIVPVLFAAGKNIIPELSMMVPTALVEKAGLYDTTIKDPSGEYLARLVNHTEEFVCLPEALYSLRASDASTAGDELEDRCLSTLKMLQTMRQLFTFEQLFKPELTKGLPEENREAEFHFLMFKVFWQHHHFASGTGAQQRFLEECLHHLLKTLALKPGHQQAKSIAAIINKQFEEEKTRMFGDKQRTFYDAKRYWTRRGKNYRVDEDVRWNDTIRTRGLEKLAGRSLIEVGCGYGEALKAIRTRFPHLALTGIDISPSMVERSRKELKNHPDIQFMETDGKSLPFKDEEFDIACTNVTLIHVPPPDIKRYITEIMRIARTARFYETAESRDSYGRTSYYFAHDYEALFKDLGLEHRVEAVLDEERHGKVYLVWKHGNPAPGR